MGNVKRAKQFETTEQIARTLADLDSALADATASVDRLSRLRRKLAGEFEDLQRAAEEIDFQSEAEFAESIGIKETLLGTLRRDLNLPHSLFGREPRYTREQRRLVAQILEVNNSTNRSGRTKQAA